MEVEFLDRLSEPVREGRAKSVSDLIRTALAHYDFSNVVVVHPAQLQISVRLPAEIRRNLQKVSRAKHTSVGQLVRAAVEAYLPELEAAVPAAAKPSRPKRARGRRRAQARP
jgi:predicted DNA-binding protein